MVRTVSFIISVVWLLCACGGNVVKSPLLPTAQNAQQTVPEAEYKIQVGDTLDVKFFYNPELSDSIMVRPDGRMSLQFARNMKVAGLTPSELEQLLMQRYEDVIDNPEITVIVRSFSTHKVYVDGEVERPGVVSLSGPLTLLQAVSSAGGFKDSARLKEIVVLRRGEDRKPVTVVVNAASIRDGTDTSQDILLKPFDIVYVPKSPIGNVNTWVDLYIRKNMPFNAGFGLSYNPGD
jgi:polysaccharide biosynthesis/export protein